MTTPPAGPQEAKDDETTEAAVRGGAPAALREALTAMLGEVGFMRSCIASGEKLTQADLDRQNAAMARAVRLLSENTVDSLDELDVERLAEALHDAMCIVSHHDRPPARCGHWPKYPLMARSTASRYRRLAATAASDAEASATSRLTVASENDD